MLPVFFAHCCGACPVRRLLGAALTKLSACCIKGESFKERVVSWRAEQGVCIAQPNKTRLLPSLYAVPYWRVLLAEQCRRNPAGAALQCAVALCACNSAAAGIWHGTFASVCSVTAANPHGGSSQEGAFCGRCCLRHRLRHCVCHVEKCQKVSVPVCLVLYPADNQVVCYNCVDCDDVCGITPWHSAYTRHALRPLSAARKRSGEGGEFGMEERSAQGWKRREREGRRGGG